MDLDELEVEAENEGFAVSAGNHDWPTESKNVYSDRSPLMKVDSNDVGLNVGPPNHGIPLHHQLQPQISQLLLPDDRHKETPATGAGQRQQSLWQQVLEREGFTGPASSRNSRMGPQTRQLPHAIPQHTAGAPASMVSFQPPETLQSGAPQQETCTATESTSWQTANLVPPGQQLVSQLVQAGTQAGREVQDVEPQDLCRVLPGPAGRLQQAAAAGRVVTSLGDVLEAPAGNTGAAPVHGDPSSGLAQGSDPDFQCDAWLAALDALDIESKEDGGPATLFQEHGAAAVRRTEAAGRVPQMLAMVVSLKASASGDVFVRLKDPTGAVSGSIHQGVIEAEPDISPGAVLVLRQVPVVVPAPRLHYLCITAKQLVQVFPANTGAQAGMQEAASFLQPLIPQQQHSYEQLSACVSTTEPPLQLSQEILTVTDCSSACIPPELHAKNHFSGWTAQIPSSFSKMPEEDAPFPGNAAQASCGSAEIKPAIQEACNITEHWQQAPGAKKSERDISELMDGLDTEEENDVGLGLHASLARISTPCESIGAGKAGGGIEVFQLGHTTDIRCAEILYVDQGVTCKGRGQLQDDVTTLTIGGMTPIPTGHAITGPRTALAKLLPAKDCGANWKEKEISEEEEDAPDAWEL